MADQKVAAIIAAYNEEATIGPIVAAIKAAPEIFDVIVVSDGSTDKTAEKAAQAGARVLPEEPRAGKGAAMKRGLAATPAQIIFFADADLTGLTAQHVSELVEPVLKGEAAMTIGLRERYGFLMDLMPKIDPLLAISGERVMKREIFEALPAELIKGFAIESTINDYCRKKRLPVRLIKMHGVSQVIKEKKLGFWIGLRDRLKMMGQILVIRIALLFKKW